jgi:hypothetical protein
MAARRIPMMQHSARRDAKSCLQLIPSALLIGALATGMCLGVVVVRAYDTRLHEAVAALQKAAALVEASSAGVVSPHTQRGFDNELRKALASIQEAMDHIVAAGVAADSDGAH